METCRTDASCAHPLVGKPTDSEWKGGSYVLAAAVSRKHPDETVINDRFVSREG